GRSRLRDPGQRRRAAGHPAVRVANRGIGAGRPRHEGIDRRGDGARARGRERFRRRRQAARIAARAAAARGGARVRVRDLRSLSGAGLRQGPAFLRTTEMDMTTTAITADMVKKLRDQTGAGMMDCKTALTEAGGSFDEAT